MQGTFLSVLFVSCGFTEGAHLLRERLGWTQSEETAAQGHIPPSQAASLASRLISSALCRQQQQLL